MKTVKTLKIPFTFVDAKLIEMLHDIYKDIHQEVFSEAQNHYRPYTPRMGLFEKVHGDVPFMVSLKKGAEVRQEIFFGKPSTPQEIFNNIFDRTLIEKNWGYNTSTHRLNVRDYEIAQGDMWSFNLLPETHEYLEMLSSIKYHFTDMSPKEYLAKSHGDIEKAYEAALRAARNANHIAPEPILKDIFDVQHQNNLPAIGVVFVMLDRLYRYKIGRKKMLNFGESITETSEYVVTSGLLKAVSEMPVSIQPVILDYIKSVDKYLFSFKDRVKMLEEIVQKMRVACDNPRYWREYKDGCRYAVMVLSKYSRARKLFASDRNPSPILSILQEAQATK